METKDTPDIYLAAAYLSFGAQITNVDNSNPRKQVFTFSGEDLDNVYLKYINKTLEVNAIKYKESLQHMHSIIHSY